MELAWSSIYVEASAIVSDKVMLEDTNLLGIDPTDTRQLDLRGLGQPICSDATIVSLLHRDGTPYIAASEVNGISFTQTPRVKERTYPELAGPIWVFHSLGL